MVDQEGRESNGRVSEPGLGMRARPHPESVVDLLVEGDKLVVHARLFSRESGRRLFASQGRHVDIRGNGARHVGVDAMQLRRRLDADQVGNDGAPVAALGDDASRLMPRPELGR